MLSKAEAELRWAELEQLEDMVGQLTLAAFKLPAGVERRDSLMMIGSFRDRIAAIKQSELKRASIMQMQQFKRTA
jgi:uncharacterized protein (UPF0216 family)